MCAARILRIYPFIPPLPGGMENHVLRLTEEQRRNGFEVSIIYNAGSPSSKDDVRVCPALNLRRLRPQAFRDLVFYVSAALALFQRRVRADVVHIHGDWSAFLLGRLVAHASHATRKVGSLHGPVRRPLWRSVYRGALKGYDVIYTTGASDARYLTACGLSAVQWQHSGVDDAFLETGTGEERSASDVVTVGSFVPVKNIELVLEIARAMPLVAFLLIGDGPQRERLEAICSTKRITNVRFTGWVPHETLPRWLRASKIFLSTSILEGTSTAMLEAMASGLAVITSGSNDYDDLIRQGANGYVIDGFDTHAYVAKISLLLDNEALRQDIGARNRAEASRHDWRSVAQRLTSWNDNRQRS